MDQSPLSASQTRTCGRVVDFNSPKLQFANRAKLELDLVPDDALEHEFYLFTNTLLNGLAQHTLGIYGQVQSTTFQPQLPYLAVAPQRRVTEENYASGKDKKHAADESMIAQDGDSFRALSPDESSTLSSQFDNSDPVVPDVLPDDVIGWEDIQQPQATHARSRIPVRSQKNPSGPPPNRKLHSSYLTPDFISLLNQMNENGYWSRLPYLVVENKRKKDTNLRDMKKQVSDQVAMLYKEYVQLQDKSIVSALLLVGGKWIWHDYQWTSAAESPVLVRESQSAEMFKLVTTARDPLGFPRKYYDFDPKFKAYWKAFSERINMVCDAFV